MQTITIELTDEEAAMVMREAGFLGKTPNRYARDLVLENTGLSSTRRKDAERFDREVMRGAKVSIHA